MSPAPKPHSAAQIQAIAAMDEAVNRLGYREAEAVATFATLEATVRQLVSFRSGGMPSGVVAGLMLDALGALVQSKQALSAHLDAVDDAVVMSGVAVAAFESPEDDTQAHHESPPPWAWVVDFAQLQPLPLNCTLPGTLPALNGIRAGAVGRVEMSLRLLTDDITAILDHAPQRYGRAAQLLVDDFAPALHILAELKAHAALLGVAATCYAASHPSPGFTATENQALSRLLDGGRNFAGTVQ